MLKVLGIIVLVLILVVVAILIYASTRPDDFRVQRSIAIKAPPEKIYALINDLHAWGAWSPWEKMDPGMKRSFGGAPAGRGATYAWEGNSKVGAGGMEITEAVAPSKVVIKLDFIKPFEGHNVAEFTLEPKGDTTGVTWAMYGPSALVAKVMGIFVSMDRMIGKDFETGLANLKAAAEK
jgi:uncharacterized protein YndB with AHSA1/START domain